jgi:hypothetical protein
MNASSFERHDSYVEQRSTCASSSHTCAVSFSLIAQTSCCSQLQDHVCAEHWTRPERPSQGTERAADAALDESHDHSSVHGSLKRSASEALAPISSSSSDEDLSDADLEPKKKKRKSTAAAQQQQLQQAVGSVNNSYAADSMTSHWAFVEAALSDYDTESDADYNDTIKRSKSPWYTQNEKSMKDVFAFVGDGHYSVLATVCKAWCAAYCIDERSPKERTPGTSYIENSRQTRSTYYQVLLHSDTLLEALWHPHMASLDWNDSDDGR